MFPSQRSWALSVKFKLFLCHHFLFTFLLRTSCPAPSIKYWGWGVASMGPISPLHLQILNRAVALILHMCLYLFFSHQDAARHSKVTSHTEVSAHLSSLTLPGKAESVVSLTSQCSYSSTIVHVGDKKPQPELGMPEVLGEYQQQSEF